MTIMYIQIGPSYIGVVRDMNENIIAATDVKDFKFDAYNGARLLRYALRYGK